jgi:hypothetical protein
MNHRVQYNFGKFFSSCTTGNFSKRAQLHEASLVQEYLLWMFLSYVQFSDAINISGYNVSRDQTSVRTLFGVLSSYFLFFGSKYNTPDKHDTLNLFPVKVTDSHGCYSSAVPLVAGSPTPQQPTMSLHGVPTLRVVIYLEVVRNFTYPKIT